MAVYSYAGPVLLKKIVAINLVPAPSLIIEKCRILLSCEQIYINEKKITAMQHRISSITSMQANNKIQKYTYATQSECSYIYMIILFGCYMHLIRLCSHHVLFSTFSLLSLEPLSQYGLHHFLSVVCTSEKTPPSSSCKNSP